MCYDMTCRQTEVAGSIVGYGCSFCSGLRDVGASLTHEWMEEHEDRLVRKTHKANQKNLVFQ